MFGKAKKTFTKKGGAAKAAYTPTAKDSFNSFLVSLIGLPFRVLNDPIPFNKEKIDEVFEKAGDKPITLRNFITKLLGVSSEDQIEEAVNHYFHPDNEGDVKSLTFRLSTFEKSLGYQQEPYKSLGLELVKGLREAYGIK